LTPFPFRYDRPFEIDTTTTITALAIQENREIAFSKASFKKISNQPVSTRSGYRSGTKAQKGGFTGPFDNRLCRRWNEGKSVYIFDRNGMLYKKEVHRRTHIGWWWYKGPVDQYEDSENVGSGELRWKNSGEISKLYLTPDGRLEIITGSQKRRFSFETENSQQDNANMWGKPHR
jgi:hypothetical protein